LSAFSIPARWATSETVAALSPEMTFINTPARQLLEGGGASLLMGF
jgi:hypothetical protein